MVPAEHDESIIVKDNRDIKKSARFKKLIK
jgi:hypothetical protein